jgi:hypothetical protein
VGGEPDEHVLAHVKGAALDRSSGDLGQGSENWSVTLNHVNSSL